MLTEVWRGSRSTNALDSSIGERLLPRSCDTAGVDVGSGCLLRWACFRVAIFGPSSDPPVKV